VTRAAALGKGQYLKPFSSLAAFVALWLGLSFALWLLYSLFRRRDGARQTKILNGALSAMDEGEAVFAALRSRASASPSADGSYRWRGDDEGDALQEDVRRLLNGIEEQSAYFDRVKAAKKKIEKTFDVPDFLPLGELLQIRRDFWAASEIFLIDDIRNLGAELAEVRSYEAFRAEALALLFKDEDRRSSAEADPVELRIALAREDVAAFVSQAEQAIAVEREKSRFPRPAEIVAAPLSVIKAAAFVMREGRTIFSDAAASARSFARTVGAKGLMAAAKELRKARGELPGQFASAFERAGGLARKGGGGLKRHYEFVLEAQELRARYAELLARAPLVSEKGRQFLARLELERRAEQFRETSGGVADWARRGVVAAIAYLIRGLQFIQAKITPQSNKQLSVVGQAAKAAEAPEESAAEESFRVLLLPTSAYAGGQRGRKTPEAKKPRKESADIEELPVAGRARRKGTAGRANSTSEEAVAEAPRVKRAASGGAGSLMDRLSTIEEKERADAPGFAPEREESGRKNRSFRISGLRRS
jgi:hypothetical protein